MPRPDAPSLNNPGLPPDVPSAFAMPGAASSLPLRGLTVLAVEDSRYTCDALRLMCQRSGARLRRAEGIAGAETHLRLYRPDVVIVDLGLPDGRGEDLIARLSAKGSGPLILATSGDPAGRGPALGAGAAAFLEKPLPGLQAFQSLILSHLPDARLRGPAFDGAGGQAGDPLALRDDLRQAQIRLRADPGPEERVWLAGFLTGLARQSGDKALMQAAGRLRGGGRADPTLAGLLCQRIALADRL